MLLRLEAENERELIHNGLKETRRLKYEGLKERRIGDRVVDMIVRSLLDLNVLERGGALFLWLQGADATGGDSIWSPNRLRNRLREWGTRNGDHYPSGCEPLSRLSDVSVLMILQLVSSLPCGDRGGQICYEGCLFRQY